MSALPVAIPVAIPVDDADPARTVLAVGLAGAFAGVLTLLVVLALLGGVLQFAG
jgi:fructose-specific phosphotransferase system IIC component